MLDGLGGGGGAEGLYTGVELGSYYIWKHFFEFQGPGVFLIQLTFSGHQI